MSSQLRIVVTPHIARHLAQFGVDPSKYSVTAFEDPNTYCHSTCDANAPIEIEHVRAPSVEQITVTRAKMKTREMANKRMRLFRTMSLMGGAGGMDIGLAQSDNKGYFRTQWAIEWSSTSIKTFRAHHPHTKTFEMDIGVALEQRDTLHGMPKRGEVDVIIMGPPCQSFSSLNRIQTKTGRFDARSMLVATGLSFVDVYRPTYGVIENVLGILTRGDLGHVPKEGVIKFIRNCLATMGYRCRITTVQCGHFGVPQVRSRVKILFSLCGVRLPLAPAPTTRMAGSESEEGGPLDGVTIDDATSDLPRWEYRNPHRFYPHTQEAADPRPSCRQPMQYTISQPHEPIGPRYANYVSGPLNDFQRLVRQGPAASANAPITMHQTVALDAQTIERICCIPFEPRANHMSLWEHFPALALPDSTELDDPFAFGQAFSRLDAQKPFQIVTTTIYLGGKLGRLLMPDQRRIPTLRELARAQGFPDGILFFGSPNEILRQIGNAVPIPLASSIGLSIRQAAIDDYIDGDRRFARDGKSSVS